MLGKDTEQWEQVVRNSGTKNSVMEGQGTVGGMEKEQMEWRDKEQCEGKTRNRGVEGQGSNEWEERTRNIWRDGKELEEEGTRNNVREGRGTVGKKDKEKC